MPGSVCPIQVTVRPIHPRAPSAKPDGGAFIHTGKFYERGVIKEMTTKKTSRRALLTSVMALVMCLVMLVGTTFAWFTDSVTSGVNTIQSGNLDVKLTYVKGTETGEVTKDTHLFNDAALWEPGHVEYVVLTASNEGSLALKYKLAVNVFGETGSVNMLGDAFQLSSYLKYAVIGGDATTAADFNRDTLTANPGTVLGSYTSEETPLYPANTEGKDSSKTVTLAVWMPTTVGNEANHKTGEAAPTIQLGVSLVATQYTAESDSFDNTYDAQAEYPEAANYPTGATIVGLDGTYDSLTDAMLAWRESKNIVTTGGNMGGHPAELTSVDTISWVISGSVGTGDGTGVVGTSGSVLSGGYIYPGITVNNIYIKGVNDAELKNELGSDYALSAGAKAKNVVYDGITFPEYVSFNSQVENVTFKNCTFKGGLKVMQANNVTVDHCKFEGDGTKDYAFFAQASTMANVVFTNNQVSNFQRGINVQDFSKTANVTISGNTIKNITGKTDGFTYGSAVQLTNAKTFTVTGNTISDVAVNALHIYDGCAADSIVIKDNNISAAYLCWNQPDYDMSKVESSGNTLNITNEGMCVTKEGVVSSSFTLQ